MLHEDRETILGTFGDAKIVLKSSNEKKLSLDKITFPQWSAANFRIMLTLMKKGALSTTEEVLDYIMYSAKISELAKCYPLPRVMQYDDLFRRMQFATKCKWGIDSQFISQQTLHRPEPTTAIPSRQTNRKTPRPVINQATGKQVCYEFQRRDGCRFGSSCRYDHVCIKPQSLGSHPQWQHLSSSPSDPQY